MKTLLHICCAPCANQPIEVLRGDKIEVTGFWYNPNIHPFTEYRARRDCLRDYAAKIELPMIEKNDYALRPFVRAVAEDIDHRCTYCYEHRIEGTARYAAEHGFDAFATSLTVSPHKISARIFEASDDGRFLKADFKKRDGFLKGNRRAAALELYRQKYCGCEFSCRDTVQSSGKVTNS